MQEAHMVTVLHKYVSYAFVFFVFAKNKTVPFVALSYEHKITGLLETLGRNESMGDITSAMNNI